MYTYGGHLEVCLSVVWFSPYSVKCIVFKITILHAHAHTQLDHMDMLHQKREKIKFLFFKNTMLHLPYVEEEQGTGNSSNYDVLYHLGLKNL